MGVGVRHYPVGPQLVREAWMRWPIWRAKVAERSMQPALDPGDMCFPTYRQQGLLLARRSQA